MGLKSTTVIVIGAGIGGLAVARALAMRGAKVTVLEQADAIREVGAGLQISPNGFAVIQALGLGDDLRRASVQAQAVNLHDYRGSRILRLDLKHLENRDYYFAHRADLIEILAKGARQAGVKIELSRQVEGVDPGEPPKVHVKDGETFEADLVVGADGLHSVARHVLNGTLAPFFTQNVAWRALVANSGDIAPEVRLFMGPRRHLVTYPLQGGKLLNLVAVKEQSAWSAESWSQTDNPESVRNAFQDFGPEVQDMLSRLIAVHLWGLFRHPVARFWHDGGVVLLGDAAHPTLPFMAQGASLALEDAWVLARALEEVGPLEARLANYQAQRQDRARKVVEAAGDNAWKYHLSSPPVRWAAHTVLRLGGRLAPKRMMRQFDWIYSHDVTKDQDS